MAQIIVAIQMVTEQKFVLQYDIPPLLAVGLEGRRIILQTKYIQKKFKDYSDL